MPEHAAVVIAEGGPTGPMLAGELALAGVDVAIVERRASQDLTGARGNTVARARWTRVTFSTRLNMQRTYYARVGALLPQSGVQGRPFARGR